MIYAFMESFPNRNPDELVVLQILLGSRGSLDHPVLHAIDARAKVLWQRHRRGILASRLQQATKDAVNLSK